KVEAALKSLADKQEDLERREKELEKTQKGLTAAPHSTMTVGTAGVAMGAAAAATLTAAAGGEAAASGAVVTTAAGKDPGTTSEWVEYWDESAGASYYFNTITQVASWTKPQEGVESIESTRALSKAAGDDGSTKRDAGAETLSQPTDARTQWTESIDEASGQPYYYNVMTGEAVWEKPPELTPNTAGVRSGTGGIPHFDNPDEWVCFLDETSGEEYWFNLTTGETHWENT
ncbi:unnamed protein product, partial [Sphacelaria rigidula]